MNLKIKLDKGKFIEVHVLMEFEVLWSGWECDSTAWVVKLPNGKNAIAMTSHGGTPYITDGMKGKVKEYEKVLADTRKALEMVEE